MNAGLRWVIPLCLALLLPGLLSARERYHVESIPLPDDPDLNGQIDGMKFLPGGKLAACFPYGKVYLYDPADGTWSLFAEGLHNPLGILPVSDRELIVAQRAELTRLVDEDGDGRADVYDVVSDRFGVSGNYHEFHFTPVRDADGNIFIALGTASSGDGIRDEVRGRFYAAARPGFVRPADEAKEQRDRIAGWKHLHSGRMYSTVPYRGWVMQVTPDGRTLPFASGLRTPNGLGFDLEGNLFASDNQGDWLGTSKLHHIRKGHFYGHPASLGWREPPPTEGHPRNMDVGVLDRMRSRACVLFPHGVMANSPTQPQVDNTGGKFGPFAGQLFIGEMNRARILRVMLEEVGGELQGACVPFIDGAGLSSGNNRLAFDRDGALWVGSTKHTWSGSSGLRKITWDGGMPFDLHGIHATPKGFQLRFTEAVAEDVETQPELFSVKRYFYRYHQKYGSPEYGVTNVLPVAVHRSVDGKQVDLELPEMKAWHLHQFQMKGLRSHAGRPLENSLVAYTLNRVPGREAEPPPDDQYEGSAAPRKEKKELPPPRPLRANPAANVLEAEAATVRGAALSTSHAGAFGRGYVDFNAEKGDSVEWTVAVPSAGPRRVFFRYALQKGDRPLRLWVNGHDRGRVSFPGTGSWQTWNEVAAPVAWKAGKNSIRLVSDGQSGPNLDAMRWE